MPVQHGPWPWFGLCENERHLRYLHAAPLEEIRSFAIITTDANEQLKPIDDRMPVILTRQAEAVWMDPTIQEPARLLPLLTPYMVEEMEAYPVSLLVNNPAHDTPECMSPLR